MRGKKNPPLDLTPEPVGTLLTFDTMARAYLEDYTLQRYRTLTTARGRVEHLREFFGGWPVESVTANAVRTYQLAAGRVFRARGVSKSQGVLASLVAGRARLCVLLRVAAE